jgi:hypothetical protein
MLKKSINSADINFDSRKRNFNRQWLRKAHVTTLWGCGSLRLWTFFSTFASLFQIEFAAVR